MRKRRILTDKKRLFAEHYTGSAAEAAVIAGITLRQAYRYLRNPDVVDFICRLNGDIIDDESANIADRTERLEFLTAVLRGEVKDIHVDRFGKAHEIAASLKERLKAAEMLCKASCDFSEKRIIEGGDSAVSLKISNDDIQNRIKSLMTAVQGDAGLDSSDPLSDLWG